MVAAFALFQGYRQDDLVRCSYLVVACGLLLTPTLYPWYLCWIVPFLCFYPNRAWLYLTGAVGASYWVWVEYNATGNWDPGMSVLVIEYAPFFALLAWGALNQRRSVAE